MTTIVLSPTPAVRALMQVQVDNYQLPAWVRLGCLTWVHADHKHGHARMATGQVARELGLTVKQTSATIATARALGFIDDTSTARCLVLLGCGNNPCEERHR